MRTCVVLGRASCFAAALLMIACASVTSDGTEALRAGNYAEAERLLLQGIQESDQPGTAWNNLGVLYLRQGNRALATQCFTMSARHGEPLAQQKLIGMGLPVPAADLGAQASSADSAAWQFLLGAAAASRLKSGAGSVQPSIAPVGSSAPSSVKCTSYINGRYVDTTCR